MTATVTEIKRCLLLGRKAVITANQRNTACYPSYRKFQQKLFTSLFFSIMLKKITQPCLIHLALGHFTLLTGFPTRAMGQKMCHSVVKPVSCVLGERKKKKKKSICDNGINEASTNKPHIHYHSFNFFICTLRPFSNHSSNIIGYKAAFARENSHRRMKQQIIHHVGKTFRAAKNES